MNQEHDYQPFGAEWKQEMMKFPKAAIIDMLADAKKESVELEGEDITAGIRDTLVAAYAESDSKYYLRVLDELSGYKLIKVKK